MSLFSGFSEEEKLLQETVRQFAADHLAPKIETLDAEEGFNRDAFHQLGALGLLGITVSEKDGGAGLGATAATIAFEEIGAIDASTALSYLAHSILCVNQIALNASDEQKKKYLPKLISGEWLGGMGMTEPGSGSDALAMRTKAVKSADGRQYTLTGTKTFITNGPVGEVFYCYAKTGEGKKDVSTFLIDRTMKGFSTGKKFSKMGMRASPTSELVFDQCVVDASARVGSEGSSLSMMMRNLDLERVTIAGISLGIARGALDAAVVYARDRRQFGKPIASLGVIQERVAEAASWLDACRALTYQCARLWDEGKLVGKEASMMAAKAKLTSAQMATKVTLDCIQILGGYGYIREFPVERFMRDAKLIEIGAGTNEILRLIIARQILGEAANG